MAVQIVDGVEVDLVSSCDKGKVYLILYQIVRLFVIIGSKEWKYS